MGSLTVGRTKALNESSVCVQVDECSPVSSHKSIIIAVLAVTRTAPFHSSYFARGRHDFTSSHDLALTLFMAFSSL